MSKNQKKPTEEQRDALHAKNWREVYAIVEEIKMNRHRLAYDATLEEDDRDTRVTW